MATLLTGVGYIGATLLRRLIERDGPSAPLVALDNFYSTSRGAIEASMPPGTRLLEGDVADPDAVARAFDALGTSDDVVVYHLAAQPSAALAARDPDTTERANLVGARVVLEAAQRRGARVVFGGSFRVYGDDLSGQRVDEHTPYGRVGDLSHLSKVYVEQLARMIGVRFVSVRLGITYGLSPIMKTTPALMTVPNLFCQRAVHGETLQVLDDRWMAFIHVEDAAAALLSAARRRGPDWDSVNAAPEVASIGQVARTVQRLAQARGISATISGAAQADAEVDADAVAEAAFEVASRLDDDTGADVPFHPGHTLSSSLGEVIDLFVQRR